MPHLVSSLSAERTTIGQAICTGDPEAVSAFLDGIDSASAIRQLVGGYGGGRKIDKVGRKVDKDVLRKDDQGLFRMTVPLLHAAYTGNIAMFSTVLGAMRAKLRAQQVNIVAKLCSVSLVECLSAAAFGSMRRTTKTEVSCCYTKDVPGCCGQLISTLCSQGWHDRPQGCALWA